MEILLTSSFSLVCHLFVFFLGTHWGETRPRAKQKTFTKGTFEETLLACNSANSVPRTYPSWASSRTRNIWKWYSGNNEYIPIFIYA